MRRSRNKSLKGEGLGQITNTVSTHERPAEAEDRAVPGHWEGDLIIGSNNSQIATLVERNTRYVMLVKVPSKDTKTVINALIKHSHKLPRELYKSLTWDRSREMADHQRFSLDTDIKVYFFAFDSSWSGLQSVAFGATQGTQSGHALDKIVVSAVPVLAAVWLFGSALAGLGWFRRKQTA